MNLQDKLTIVLYTSVKGHFGFKNSYKFTIENLKQELGADFNKVQKFCNIKRENDDEEIFNEMFSFLRQNDFEVFETKGEWTHNNKSHAVGYYKDMLNVFDNMVHTEFAFVEEDDWFLKKKNDNPYTFSFAIEGAIKFLERNKNALCVRVNSEPNRTTKGATRINDLLYRQDEDYTKFGSTFTFQPTILRTRDWWQSLRIINNNLNLLETVHCEILSGHVFKQFSSDISPFYFFNPNELWCEHIGEKEKLEKLNETNTN